MEIITKTIMEMITTLVQIITISIFSITRARAGVLHGSALPGNIIPEHYKFHLTVTYDNLYNFKKNEYSANVEIDLKVIKENVLSIILNARDPKDMKYQEVFVQHPNGSKQKLQVGEYLKDKETQEFKAEDFFPVNQSLKLCIKFTNLFLFREGIFRVTPYVVDQDPRKGFFIFTHGQPDHIRKIFPCFDEPAYKATFEISVSLANALVDKGYNVLTNTELEKESRGNGKTTFLFKKTPVPISSYLVAISVTRFNHTLLDKFNSPHPYDENNHEFKVIRTFGPKRKLELDKVRKMHLITRGMLEYFTKKFKVGYAFEKLDQVFVEDFAYYGMENFGLIFYRLQKIQSGDITELSYVEAHEIAHQWFGNLVTVKDWTNDFWIQEGFAHYYATNVLDEVKVNGMPAGYYDFSTDFVVKNILPTLKGDSYDLAPPVIDAVNTLFGGSYVTLTYDKAAALIRMLKLSYGTDVFDNAMQLYFRLFKEKNADTTDLINCFDLALKKIRPNWKIPKPSEIKFTNWIKYKGYPLIEQAEFGFEDPQHSFILFQKRFIHRNETRKPVEDHKWIVPITYSTSDNPNFENTTVDFFMGKMVRIDLPRRVEWIIINHQMAGYYRVNYHKDNWEGIIKVLNDKNKFTIIHELNRVQLLDDILTFATAESEHQYLFPSYALALKLYKYLEHENNYYPWKAAIDRFLSVDCITLTGCKEFQTGFHAIVTKKYHEIKDKLTGNLSYKDQMLKKAITDFYCTHINASACRVKAYEVFYDDFFSGDIDHLDLSKYDDIQCCNIIRETNEENWINLWTTYLKLKDDDLKKKVLSCLACARNRDTMNKYLGKVIDKNLQLESWERAQIFYSVSSSSPHNAQLALRFLMVNNEPIREIFNGYAPMVEFFDILSKNLQSFQDIEQMNFFFKQVASRRNPNFKYY